MQHFLVISKAEIALKSMHKQQLFGYFQSLHVLKSIIYWLFPELTD